ncbi:MAG: fluoride efflux transporter CrcB [Flavobacteriaceae bacterium]|nr:fluoride efflux transporter CrcB [Flavobacteriaceae bacterium]
MKQALLVFLGGGAGSVLRFYLTKAFNPLIQNFFLGTFVSNILGSLLIGVILGLSVKQQVLSNDQSLLLATGFCGGFTTFSAFAFEKHSLLQTGQFVQLALYLMASIIVGIACVALGLWLAKMLS